MGRRRGISDEDVARVRLLLQLLGETGCAVNFHLGVSVGAAGAQAGANTTPEHAMTLVEKVLGRFDKDDAESGEDK